MTGRILRIELRRSPVAFIALLSIVIGTALLISYPTAFTGRWMQLAVAVRMVLLVLLPLALAGGAWVGRRDAAYRVDELFASTVRPRWQRVLPTAAALAIAVVAAYLLVFLAGTPWVVPTSRYFPVAAIGVSAVGALSLVAAGWLGMAAGRAVPRLFTAPALAVLGAGLAGILPILVSESAMMSTNPEPGPAALLLTPIHGGNIDDFQTIVAGVSVAQALWLTALAVTGLLLLGAVSRRGVALAVLPTVLGAAIAVPLLPAGGYRGATAIDPAAVELVCDDDGPRVCLTRVRAHLLPDVAPPARQALAMLAAKLPDAPTRAVESTQPALWAGSSEGLAPVPHRADTLDFNLGAIGITDRAEYADTIFVSFLLRSAWVQDCPTGLDEWPTRPAEVEGGYVFQAVVAAWLDDQPTTLRELADPEAREQAEAAYRALTALPQAEQGRRMAAARAAVLDCRGDALLPILSGAAS